MEKGLSYTGDQESDGHSSWAPWSYADGRNLQKDNITATLHDLGFMAVWPNSILSSVNTHENTHGICKKQPKGPSDSEKQDYLVWWTSILSIMFEGTSSAHRLQSTIPKVKCAGSSSCCGAVFSGREWGTRQSRRKAQCTKNIEIALRKPSPEHSEPQTGQKVHFSTGQWP